MPVAIQKITNGNLYLDGESFMGRAEEITLPKIETNFTEHKGLGLHGTLELPGGLKAMEAKIKWGNVYTEVMRKAANPYKARMIMVRSSAEIFTSAGRIAEFPCVTIMNGFFRNVDAGVYAQNTTVNLETDLSVHYLKITHAGVVLLEVDVMNNIYRAEGSDLLLNYKLNVGI